ncbi:SDR family oxidoreductase [Humibacter sp.]|jgi:short-subunit dehydrogenase|uniref:SDR family oxidoreductase n=1 Tax=Humibacter sp. TaxID=1940291 RepID=UPI002CCA87FC|nr:SDR family oxidoreductase [Humibacter sp.]HVX08435.1 SDR family oxidoreductase [Humibacter sp.]
MARTVRGARILITGAASGMGRLYAERAVLEGAKSVVLWDVDREALDELAEVLRAVAEPGSAVFPFVVDVSELGAIAQAAHKTRKAAGDPDILINNAGIVRGALFWEHDNGDDTRKIMQVNALAPMYVTREFLPAMIKDAYRAKRIVNIASAAGLLSNPRMSVYAASKWAVIGWSDSLRLELEREDHGNVKVTTVAPSYIDTGMFEGARGPLLTPVMRPEYVADRVWDAMLAGRPLLTLPRSVALARALKGVLPVRAWDAIAGPVFGVYSSMDGFVGRR